MSVEWRQVKDWQSHTVCSHVVLHDWPVAMPGLLESVLEQYEPVRRTWEEAFHMSDQDCMQLCHWALRNGSIPMGVNAGRPYLLSARNWVAFCTDMAESKQTRYMLPDGRPNCGFFFGKDYLSRPLKQIELWKWLAEQKQHGLTAGSTAQISRTRVEYCTAFLNHLSELQFSCCEQRRTGGTVCWRSSTKIS